MATRERRGSHYSMRPLGSSPAGASMASRWQRGSRVCLPNCWTAPSRCAPTPSPDQCCELNRKSSARIDRSLDRPSCPLRGPSERDAGQPSQLSSEEPILRSWPEAEIGSLQVPRCVRYTYGQW